MFIAHNCVLGTCAHTLRVRSCSVGPLITPMPMMISSPRALLALRDELTVDVGTAGNLILILHTLLPAQAAPRRGPLHDRAQAVAHDDGGQQERGISRGLGGPVALGDARPVVLDDEFAKGMGFDDLETLKKVVKDQLAKVGVRVTPRPLEMKALREIAAKTAA